MKSLATLIKLQKNLVDEQRLHIARLQEHLDQIEKNIAALEIEKAREQVAANSSPEARLTYGAFLASAIKRGDSFEKERRATAQAIEIARAKLTELFEEQKRYEIAEETRQRAEVAEEQRRERIILDEVGSVGFIRKQDKDGSH